jgi:hypothetical protein
VRLVLEHGIGPVAPDLERVGAVGGLHRLVAYPRPLRVAGEHLVEVARPDARLVAPGAGADLHDDVLLVVGVALDHREAELLLQALDTSPRHLELLAHLRVVALVEQLLRALGVGGGEPPLRRERGGGRELPDTASRRPRSARGPR